MMRSNGTIDWPLLGHRLRNALAVTAALLLLFYAGVMILPVFVRALASRSLYNYRDLAAEAVAERRFDAAVGVIERAAREIPREIFYERPEFMFDDIGRIRKEQGRVAESLDAFLKAQSFFFRNIELQGYLPPPRLIRDVIDAYFELSNFAGAYQEARAAMDMYPPRGMREQFVKAHDVHSMEDPRIMRDLGLLEARLGMLAPAQARLRQSLARDSRIAESHFALGRIAEDEKRTDQALAEYEAELMNHPFSENAYDRLLTLTAAAKGDTETIVLRRREMRAKTLAQFINVEKPYEPLASLFGIGAFYEQSFDLPEPGNVLFSIVGHSTPCQGLYGWVEFLMDGRHIQTIYVDSTDARGYDVWLNGLDAGRHSFRFDVLSDANDATGDRNVFIHTLRIYRLP